jgi:hypothetical protein
MLKVFSSSSEVQLHEAHEALMARYLVSALSIEDASQYKKQRRLCWSC